MSQIKTLYGNMPTSTLARFSQIRLLVCDVDGIFSDGRIYLGNQGEEIKAFHTLDGYGIKAVLNIGIEVAVITGRHSQIVHNRMSALGVRHIIQGAENKQQAMTELLRKCQYPLNQVAAMGDDMPDLGMFEHSGLRLSVPQGHPYVQQQADYVTQRSGGFGAVREICDLLLQSQNKLELIHGSST
ncbi:3-deoxy-manno-octulosonate-8-phosphatase KdsC [Lacimicrobium alkaliphilum]|uniref:3-deoxy-D-manno-octulosonate 8-phosphate phosphatase KdsC n=1 Tax=Lacimicrobium alkaliphilum TaxID=1526571 RepID=A0ABQ1QWQ7_9ALTE|nr:3-deoxy-manno-octulosonate-8-phosphatase KdsC [Lacimicrobium alkaliphilum]GGD50215.1 3-deoxy-D-manno-octulosonate 8-phosphate phosphatase [Lacimicrobium alkaliphilum]